MSTGASAGRSTFQMKKLWPLPSAPPGCAAPKKSTSGSQKRSGNSRMSLFRLPMPRRSIASALAGGRGGSKAIVPALRTPCGRGVAGGRGAGSGDAARGAREQGRERARAGRIQNMGGRGSSSPHTSGAVQTSASASNTVLSGPAVTFTPPPSTLQRQPRVAVSQSLEREKAPRGSRSQCLAPVAHAAMRGPGALTTRPWRRASPGARPGPAPSRP